MPHRNLSFSLHRSAGWVLIIGVAVSLIGSAWLYQKEQRSEHALFERRAQARATSIEQGIAATADALTSVNQIFSVTGNNVSREQFRAVTQPMLGRYSYIDSFAVTRLVPNEARPSFEAQMRASYPGFRIDEIVDGQRVPAPERPYYRVIDYVEPTSRSAPIFGVNTSNAAFMNEAIQLADDTGRPAATGVFALLRNGGMEKGIRIFMAIYRNGAVPDEIASRRQAVVGYTVAVLRAHELFEKILALASGTLGNADLDISVYASDREDKAQLAYRSANHNLEDPARRVAYTFFAAARPWHIVIQAQSTPFFPTHTAALSALLLGLLITAGLTGYLHNAATRGRKIEELVALRTEEIRHLNEQLNQDIKIREQVEQKFAISEERARDMADMSSDWYWEQDEHFRFINLSSDVMGEEQPPGFVMPPGVLGRSRWELPVDLQASDWDAHRAILQAHQPFKDFEYRMQLAGIEIEWISATGKPVFDDQGNFKGYRGTAKDITARKRIEEALRQSRAELRRLADHMNEVKESERKRIARDIHDELGQNLLALRIDVSLLDKGMQLPAHMKARVETILNHIDDTIQSVRAIINDLRPGVLDLGLHAALEWQAKEFERRTGIACSLQIDHEEFDLDDALTTGLFRAVQEALTNIQRHAKATHVQIALLRKGEVLEVQITDNGIGVSPSCRRKANSFGLVGIEERMQMLGGTWSITGNTGQGTTIAFSVPI